ncbi:MAG TPA: iron-sulfur cluster assembly scaffold protein [Rhizomicrobium sp.]|jgi:nitrogen fixation NifU-like protein
MSDTLYRKDLLRLAADAHGAGTLASPNACGEAYNPACGDRVKVQLLVADGQILEMAHETKACVLAQASISILAQGLKGAKHAQIQHLHDEIAGMLAAHAPPPARPFDSYEAFVGAVEYPGRHRCVLLPIEAVLDALDSGEPDGIGRRG